MKNLNLTRGELRTVTALLSSYPFSSGTSELVSYVAAWIPGSNGMPGHCTMVRETG